jgi:hypothetical protein
MLPTHSLHHLNLGNVTSRRRHFRQEAVAEIMQSHLMQMPVRPLHLPSTSARKAPFLLAAVYGHPRVSESLHIRYEAKRACRLLQPSSTGGICQTISVSIPNNVMQISPQ